MKYYLVPLDSSKGSFERGIRQVKARKEKIHTNQRVPFNKGRVSAGTGERHKKRSRRKKRTFRRARERRPGL